MMYRFAILTLKKVFLQYMKLIFTFFIILFAPLMCSNNPHIPKYFKNYNVVWQDDDQVFILVRHGEKQTGDDPHLTEEGVQRSLRLSEILKGPEDYNIYSSNYNRTKETVQPLIDRTGEEMMIYDARKLDDFSKQLLSTEPGVNVISGHSNTTPNLANKLCNCTAFPSIDESVYKNIYIVVQSDSLSRTYILNY